VTIIIILMNFLIPAIFIASVRCDYTVSANFTESYSAVFDVFEDGDNSYAKTTLIYRDLPLDMEVNGGFWMGIAFGAQSMLGADLITCQWMEETQKGWCFDRIHIGDSYPDIVPDVDSETDIRTISAMKGDNYVEIRFQRKLRPDDLEQDVEWVNKELNHVIWAHGDYGHQYHGLT
jgi:hypothetical protein